MLPVTVQGLKKSISLILRNHCSPSIIYKETTRRTRIYFSRLGAPLFPSLTQFVLRPPIFFATSCTIMYAKEFATIWKFWKENKNIPFILLHWSIYFGTFLQKLLDENGVIIMYLQYVCKSHLLPNIVFSLLVTGLCSATELLNSVKLEYLFWNVSLEIAR